jgi:ABC-type uncharacterized transport system auxiliary subunit
MIPRPLWILVVVSVFTGCGSVRAPTIKYYKLDVPPVPAPTGPPVTASLRIEPFHTASLLRQDRIVYRPSAVEVGFYEYHRWAEPPNDTLTRALADQIMKRRFFQSVAVSNGVEKADYVLRGNVERLQEVDYPGAVRVQVSISAELEDPVRKLVIWSGAASSEWPVSKGDVQAVVAAMGQASQQGIARLAADIAKFVQANRLAAQSSQDTPVR